jgi:Na+/proline symporter
LRNKASGSLENFFLGGRNLPWYIAGLSMVATTFAADTPLWVTEKVAQHGVSGNWLWWNMLLGGMLTTFFFARYWRRAGIVTELELIEIRYHGKAAAWLRGFKAGYLGLFMNTIIVGWVNFAMMTILQVFFGLSTTESLVAVSLLMVGVALYTTLSGLLGVALTDALQFTLAMTGSFLLAYHALDLPAIGGLSGLKAQLPAWRFELFPQVNNTASAVGTFSLTIGAFFSYVFVQWWASWYPGAEPGGGGYISQRMMSVRTEKDAVYASLFFQIAHYALRPWPWIIVALCSLVLYPELPDAQRGHGFVMVMRDFLPSGLKGLLFVAFLSAYMSTISTQLNWGSSYLTNDLYARFIRPSHRFAHEEAAQKHYVGMGRWFTLLIMALGVLATAQIQTIDQAAQFLIAAGAGLGMVLILRWYWWRINAWSEVAATLAPLVGLVLNGLWLEKVLPPWYVANNGPLLTTVILTTAIWLTVTFLTKPTQEVTLQAFCARVQPAGWWQGRVPSAANRGLKNLFWAWLGAVLLTYSLLFAVGEFLFLDVMRGWMWLATAFVGGFVLVRNMKHT